MTTRAPVGTIARRTFAALLLSIVAGIATIAPAPAVWQFRTAQTIGIDFPLLMPGSETAGSWAATATPAAQGDSGAFGYSEAAIAGWDTPQFIEVNKATGSSTADQIALVTPMQKVCVDAFHINAFGIQKVSFSLNGGPWADVFLPLFTPEAGAPEYCAYVNVATFGNNDTPFEIRAIAYPFNGVPQVLQGGSFNPTAQLPLKSSLWGYAAGYSGVGPIYYLAASGASSSCGSFNNPCASLQAIYNSIPSSTEMGGATICVKEDGSYNPTINVTWNTYVETNRYLTIRSCGAATRNGVVFSSSTLGYQNKIHYQDIRFTGTISYLPSKNSSWGHIWADNLNAVSLGTPGTTSVSNSFAYGQKESVYVTGGTYYGYGDSFKALALVRGAFGTQMLSDLFQDSQMVVNSVGSYSGIRFSSGPYTITEIIDATHIRIAKTFALYAGDCLQGSGLSASCTSPTYKISGDPDNTDTTSNGGQGSTVLTLSAALGGTTPTTFMQQTSAHADIYQTVGGHDGVIIYNTVAKDNILGQGLGFGGANILNAAFVLNDWNSPANTTERSINMSGSGNKNVLIDRMNLPASPRLYGGAGSSDVVIRNSLCAGGTATYSGYTPGFDNSPTCQ